MNAAAAEAERLELIDAGRRALLRVRVTGSQGLSNLAEEIDPRKLRDYGFVATMTSSESPK
jgi:hypothetical protein